MELADLALPAVFLAGVISFLSPCVLPLVPAYISYIAGESVGDTAGARGIPTRLSILGLSLFFVFGFSTVFILLGASASTLGQWLLQYRYETGIVGGLIIIIFGLFMTGVIKLPHLQRDTRFQINVEGGRPLSAYLLGLAFGFGWTPCIGPVLGTVLAASAYSATLSKGIALLSIYALGLSLPFLAAAFFTEELATRLKSMRRFGRTLHLVAGIVLIITGITMITGQLSAFGFWLLRTFPVFSTVG